MKDFAFICMLFSFGTDAQGKIQGVPSREKNTDSLFLFLMHLYRSGAGWCHAYCGT